MLRRRACIAIVAALGFVLPGAVAARADVLSASVSATPTGQEMPPGFVGVSFEYRALHQYTGRDPRAVNPVLLSLLAGLAAGQSPVIRIGGDSTDGTWWPIRGQIPQGGIYYPLTKGWLRTTQALAADLNAKLILGINLAAGRPAIAAAEGRAFMQGIGRKYIDALEIGNEPDLYNVFPWYKDRRGHIYRARGRGYNLSAYTKQFLSGLGPCPTCRWPARRSPDRTGWASWAPSSAPSRGWGWSPTTAIRCGRASPIPPAPASPRSPTCWPTAPRPAWPRRCRRSSPSRTATTWPSASPR